jgi:S-(hydroxymethyl)glutathione dehydrogenase/alcohol dehydrogenase
VEVVDSIELDETGRGMVRVAICASGVCHSDLSILNGTVPQPLPCVLGHEAAGRVVEVGAGVNHVAVGDHVVIVWVPPCGTCSFCLTGQANLCTQNTFSGAGMSPHHRLNGQPVFALAGAGTFAEEVLVAEQAAVKIPPDIPWDVASLIGCAVTTGVAAATNAANVKPGSSVVVFGCGGVGISAIQGARLACAAEIVAVDLVEQKRKDALSFGATHAVAPTRLGEPRARSLVESDSTMGSR